MKKKVETIKKLILLEMPKKLLGSCTKFPVKAYCNGGYDFITVPNTVPVKQIILILEC